MCGDRITSHERSKSRQLADVIMVMVGFPGFGRTMLASRRSSILPRLDIDHAIETTREPSAAGQPAPDPSMLMVRPVCAAHHRISDTGLVGGGTVPRPGEVSLAHNGVLFLDESPKFKRGVLEGLRSPRKDGYITLTKARKSVKYSVRFMWVATMNP